MCNDNSSPTLTNCTFSNNNGLNLGGGMLSMSSSSPTLTNCTFNNNHAGLLFPNENYGRGGGMYSDRSSPTLTDCTFTGNTADAAGGGMYNKSSAATVTHCTFIDNTRGYYGGEGGGGIFNGTSSSMVRNTILWGNTATSGPEVYDEAGSTPTVEYCVIQGGYPGATNITDDPLLGTLGDYGGATETIPLLIGSSAIDAAETQLPMHQRPTSAVYLDRWGLHTTSAHMSSSHR